jgi:pimeloyl-ACP methyl ester carboxylesterase
VSGAEGSNREHVPLTMSSSNSVLAPRSRFIRVQRADLHYVEWGTAANPPLLLLHGGAAHAHWWDHIASALARDYWVFALDLRGHGDSSWIVPPAYEVEDYVADLEEVIATLNIVPLVLLGHSLGGFIALTYATAHAGALRALIVVDIGFRLTNSRFMRLLRYTSPPVYADEADLLRRFRLLPAETRAALALLQYIAKRSVISLANGSLKLKCDRATLTREPRSLLPRLEQITCPTLFVRGADSSNLSPTTLAKMAALCPRARGVEIPHAGHHVFLDQPASFLDEVQSFLSEVSGEAVNVKTSK